MHTVSVRPEAEVIRGADALQVCNANLFDNACFLHYCRLVITIHGDGVLYVFISAYLAFPFNHARFLSSVRVVGLECRTDSECQQDRACIENVCQEPCLAVGREPCGLNGICRTEQHRPVCYCPDGWGGDPHVQCFRRKI